MPALFLGMNPYLENPEVWPEVHSRSIIAIADAIAPQVRPKYRVAVEKWVYHKYFFILCMSSVPLWFVRKIDFDKEFEP